MEISFQYGKRKDKKQVKPKFCAIGYCHYIQPLVYPKLNHAICQLKDSNPGAECNGRRKRTLLP
jgi:hypothetical protein